MSLASDDRERFFLKKSNVSAQVVTQAVAGHRRVLLLTDTDSELGTPSNQGSEHFRDWRKRGERLLRAQPARSEEERERERAALRFYSSHFFVSSRHHGRETPEEVRRAAMPGSARFCGAERLREPVAATPDCAIVEAAVCRRAAHVLRFGSGTFSEFLIGDAPTSPPSTQFLNCSHIIKTAHSLQTTSRKQMSVPRPSPPRLS